MPRGDVTLETLAGDIDGEIADLIRKGVSDDELARAKNRMISDAIYAQDSQAALARAFGATLATGRTIEDVQHWPQKVDAVTAGEVVAAAKKYLDIRRSVTGYLVGAPAEVRS